MAVHKKRLMDYFVEGHKGQGLICNTRSIKAYIPRRYEIQDLLFIKESIQTLGIFQVFVEEEKEPYNLVLPGIITMYPGGTEEKTIDEVAYLIANFSKGDIFMDSMTIIKQTYVLSKMFIEFFRNGHVPSWMNYDQMATLFDTAQVTCGATLPVPHAILEMIIAHCSRYPTELNLKYRFSKQDVPPKFLGLRNVTDIRDSTTSKLVGSYVMDGINSAIVNQSEQRSEVEDLLRM